MKQQNIQPIDVIDAYDLNYCLGNALVNLLRADGNRLVNLSQVIWYVRHEMARLEAKRSQEGTNPVAAKPPETGDAGRDRVLDKIKEEFRKAQAENFNRTGKVITFAPGAPGVYAQFIPDPAPTHVTVGHAVPPVAADAHTAPCTGPCPDCNGR